MKISNKTNENQNEQWMLLVLLLREIAEQKRYAQCYDNSAKNNIPKKNTTFVLKNFTVK